MRERNAQGTKQILFLKFDKLDILSKKYCIKSLMCGTLKKQRGAMKKTNAIYEMAQEFLMIVDDYQSDIRNELLIVNPERYHEFVDFVLKIRVKPQIKLIALLQLSCGGRISEIINIKRKDIDLEKGQLKIKVLKKRKFKIKTKWAKWIPPILQKKFEDAPEDKIKFRWGAIHPAVLPLLSEWVEGMESEQQVFKITRQAMHVAYKKLFGMSTHALRHSMITYMVEIKNKGWDWIMNHFYFTELKTAHRYFKQSTSAEAAKIFKDK